VRLNEEMDAIANDYHIQLTHAEENYYAAMHEMGACAGKFACLGGDFLLLVLILVVDLPIPLSCM